MLKLALEMVVKNVVEEVNGRIVNEGIDLSSFNLAYIDGESGCPDVVWNYLRVLEDGTYLLDMLDDLNLRDEGRLDFRLDDFAVELSDAQKAVFSEVEPMLGVFRRIRHLKLRLDDLSGEVFG